MDVRTMVEILPSRSRIQRQACEDSTDRLSRRWSVRLLLSLAAFIVTEQLSGSPIECWAPPNFTPPETTYANKICWVQNQYYEPYANDSVKPFSGQQGRIAYYHYVPLVLAFQALMCVLPGWVWTTLCQQSSFNLSGIIDTACKVKKNSAWSMDYIIRQVSHMADTESSEEGISLWEKILNGRAMCISFLLVKLGYTCNALTQLILMEVALGGNSHPYGLSASTFDKFNHGINDTDSSTMFARTIVCAFKIRRLGNLHRYAIQCTLPINRLNEGAYLILWFWFLFLSCIACVDLCRWCGRLLLPSSRKTSIVTILRASGSISQGLSIVDDSKEVALFSTSYLSLDGVLAVQLIDVICGRYTAARVTRALWNRFKEENAFLGDIYDEEIV